MVGPVCLFPTKVAAQPRISNAGVRSSGRSSSASGVGLEQPWYLKTKWGKGSKGRKMSPPEPAQETQRGGARRKGHSCCGHGANTHEGWEFGGSLRRDRDAMVLWVRSMVLCNTGTG